MTRRAGKAALAARRNEHTPTTGRHGGRVTAVTLAILALLTCKGVLAQPVQETASAMSAQVRSEHARATRTASTLDGRVQLMAKELRLDAQQQASLRQILIAQRDEVVQVWNDASMPSGVRIGATQAISERTADRIRDMLTDEQREKYAKNHRHDAPVGAGGGDVQKWMKPDLINRN